MKKETITQVLVMVLKSFKKFFNGSTCFFFYKHIKFSDEARLCLSYHKNKGLSYAYGMLITIKSSIPENTEVILLIHGKILTHGR